MAQLVVLEKNIDTITREIEKIVDEIKKISIKTHESTLKIENLQRDLAKLEQRLEVLQQTVSNSADQIREEVKRDYVSNEKYEPTRLIVWGMVGIVLVTVFGALVALAVVG